MIDDVRTVLVDMPTTVRGFVFVDSTGEPCIVLNSRMSCEIQHSTYLHELDHIHSGQQYDDAYFEYSA